MRKKDDAVQFVSRPGVHAGGRLAVTADHPVIKVLMQTAGNGKAVTFRVLPNSSVRLWLRYHGGFVVRTSRTNDGYICWCEPIPE